LIVHRGVHRCASGRAVLVVNIPHRILQVDIAMQRASHHPSARAGLTLIELIVVLVVLVGLAGIIIPMLPSMLTRTHTATAATNIQEINKWIQTYEQLYFKYPDNWDALVDDAGALSDYVREGGRTQQGTLTGNEPTALLNSGISNLVAMQSTAPNPVGVWSATFSPYKFSGSTATLIPVADQVKVRILSPAGISQLNLSSNGKYVIVGLGKLSTMIGRVTAEPPLHFSDEGDANPANSYMRYGVIFKVSDTTVNMDRAVLSAVVDFAGDEGLMGVNDHLQEYYNTVNASK
jgi:Tfp pilus assembly protein PilE